MNRIVKRWVALGLSLMLGVIGSVGAVNEKSYRTAVAKAAAAENGQKAASGGIDILDYESNPSATEFVVNDIAGFEKIAELVNSGTEKFTGKTITLNADLEYDKAVENNHNVIGNLDHPFDGIFDGGFHTISGIHLNSDLRCVGLFGEIGSNGKISKIILEDASIEAQGVLTLDTYYAGGIVSGPCLGDISKCISVQNVAVTGGDHVRTGGIIGDTAGNISRCINYSTVKGYEVGGIVGGAGSSTKIRECINYGMIYSGSSGSSDIGGICGLLNGEIVECCNMGNVVAENKVSGTPYGIGGIAGGHGKVANCYNIGKIIGTESLYAGGIIGTSNFSPRIIKNSYSVGEVRNGYPGAITSVYTDCIWELSNCYWLTGTAPDGVCETGRHGWMSESQDTSSVFEYDLNQMTSQNFVDELNVNCRNMGYDEVWEPDDRALNYGYPVLKNVPYTVEDLTNSNSIFNGFEYQIMEDGKIGIVKYHWDGSNTALEVPAEIGGISVTKILDGAFADCAGLTGITIPDSVTGIGAGAFKGCTGLTGITIPDGVASMGDSIFEGCTGLRKISMPTGVTSIGGNAFRGCINLTEVILPDSVVNIGNGAFTGCARLTEISIPVSVKNIANGAFSECSGLTDVYYAGTKEQWGGITIDSASGLEDERITIHYKEQDETEKIYEYNELDEKTIEITKYNGSDEKVIIPAQLDGKDVVKIGNGAFNNCENLKEVMIPSCVLEIDKDAFNCPNLIAFDVNVNSESFSVEDGVLFNKEKTKLVRCPMGKSGEYTVPSGVVSIEGCAFRSCKKLGGVTVPDGVTKIGDDAFRGCGAVFIILSDNVVEIGDNAFLGCESLRKIHIPNGVKEIKRDMFLLCKSLTEVHIPEGVLLIDNYAFGRCENLKSIIIPASVSKICALAFYRYPYPSSLEDIYYNGTREQWEQIEVPGSDEGSTSEKLFLHDATIHFKNSPIVLPEEPIQPEVRNPKQELESLKSNGTFQLDDFKHYLTEEQMGILEDYLYTWLAHVNYAYQYSGSSTVKELVMKKAGIDPDGDFASGMEQAITHISVNTKYGTKTFEITMGLGQPDSSGNLYPGYSVMHYEVLEKNQIPSGVPVSGQIVRNGYADMGAFVESVKRASEDALHGTYQWQQLEDDITAGVLIDKTAAEIVGNKNGSFSDGTFIIYVQPLFAYSKIVKISCPVDVHVYGMDGTEAGSIVDNQPSGGDQHVRLDVDGDTKTVYLAGDDYYLNLRGTGTGTMQYEVEEVANEEVRRNVQFLELQLKNDMQYEGYVFRPLNIDRDLYALRAVEKNGTGGEVFRADKDSYQALFKKVQGLSLSQKNTSLESNRTVQLSASHYPLDASNPNLRWTTDNESVVRVDENGLVTAVGSGRATVTVSTKDGSFLKQFCVIDVAGSNIDDNDSDHTGGENSGTGGNGSSGENSGTGGNGSGGNGSGSTGGSSTGGSSSGGSGTSDGTAQKPSVVKVHYVLQFDLNGGTKTSRRTMTLLSGDMPGIMPKAQRKDYTFNGWYTQQQGGEKVSGDKPLEAAATLYARWEKASAPAKPASPALVSKKKGQIQIRFQKVDGAAGYQATYSANKNFASAKTKEAKASVKTKTISGLKAGKKYYVRVRAYRLDSMGNRIYGAYSAVKSVKIKN